MNRSICFGNSLTVGVAALFMLSAATAQQGKPPLSPPANTEVTINGHQIRIDYSAPSMRGRKIMGELVPYGKVWRTGANSATKLTTDAALDIGGLKVPAGTYTLYTLPGENEWSLIVNKQTGQWGTVYTESQDLGRVKMNVTHTSAPVEKMAIMLSNDGGNKGTLKIEWENTSASVPITVE